MQQQEKQKFQKANVRSGDADIIEEESPEFNIEQVIDKAARHEVKAPERAERQITEVLEVRFLKKPYNPKTVSTYRDFKTGQVHHYKNGMGQDAKITLRGPFMRFRFSNEEERRQAEFLQNYPWSRLNVDLKVVNLLRETEKESDQIEFEMEVMNRVKEFIKDFSNAESMARIIGGIDISIMTDKGIRASVLKATRINPRRIQEVLDDPAFATRALFFRLYDKGIIRVEPTGYYYETLPLGITDNDAVTYLMRNTDITDQLKRLVK